MANAVYDPETENQRGYDPQKTPKGDPTDPRGDLAAAEQGGGFYNPGGDAGSSAKAVSPGGLKNSEESGEGDSLYNPSDRGSRLQRAKARFRSFYLNKWALGAAAGAGGIVAIIILLFILLGSFKLPNVMQHIEAYQFARVTRQFSENAQRTTDEALAIDAASEGTAASGATAASPGGVYGALKDKYQGLRDNTWGKLDNYRPNKVIENLGKNEGLELRYRTSALTGREIFTGGSIRGVDFNVEPVTGIAKWTPGVNQILKFRNRMAFNQSGFFQAVAEAEKTAEVGPIIRGSVFRALLKDTGSSLAGYVLSKFASTSAEADEVAAVEEMYQATEAGANATDNARTAQVVEADAATEAAVHEAAHNPQEIKNIIEHGGDYAPAQAAADAALDPSFSTTALGVANPVYAAAVPICIVYDGSVQRSGPAINNQINRQQAAFATLAAQADEQKAGGPPNNNQAGELGNAAQATASQIGDISQSNPEIRASGGTVNTTDVPSAEAGSGGGFDFSIFNALGIPSSSPEGQAINWTLDNACPTLTNLYVAGGLALANIVAAIVSFGSTQAAEEAAGQAASRVAADYIKTVVTAAIEKLTAKEVEQNGVKTIERGALNRVMRFTFKQGLIVGGVVGATDLAHIIVAARSGVSTNGFAMNTDLVNEADSGANIQGGELNRHMMFGRPLEKNEVAQSDRADMKALAYQNQTRSFSQRYFALNNADSLASHVGLAIDSSLHKGIIAAIVRLGASILRPLSSLSALMGSVNRSALADPDPSTQHYGNVQFGWSEAEENIIDSNNSYTALENQQILDTSGNETAIAQKYAKCFGYSADSTGALSPNIDNDGSLSNLLSNGDILRDSAGNVINVDSALCSPAHLGPGNSEFGPQMVFRWRLAQSYSQTLDQLTQEQEVTATNTAPTDSTSTGNLPSGSAKQLAQQILQNNNVGYEFDAKQDMQDAAAGRPATAGKPLSTTLLQLIAELAQNHKFNISALESHGQGHSGPGDPHYEGDAVDIVNVDGDPTSNSGIGRTANDKAVIRELAPLMPKSTHNDFYHWSGFGQIRCGSTPPLPNGIVAFDDTCSHLHIQIPVGSP